MELSIDMKNFEKVGFLNNNRVYLPGNKRRFRKNFFFMSLKEELEIASTIVNAVMKEIRYDAF